MKCPDCGKAQMRRGYLSAQSFAPDNIWTKVSPVKWKEMALHICEKCGATRYIRTGKIWGESDGKQA